MESNPDCASTSAEKPDGMASQPLTTALPDDQICLTLFAIGRALSLPYCCRTLGAGPGWVNACGGKGGTT